MHRMRPDQRFSPDDELAGLVDGALAGHQAAWDALVARLERVVWKAVNMMTFDDAIRDGALGQPRPTPFVTRTADLGVPTVNLDRALQLAADLEDEELLRKQRRGA